MKVVVLGAGVIGAAVADALALRGADVTILDMRPAGDGASQASAGMLAPYKEAHGDHRMLELGTRSLALYDDFVGGLTAATGLAIEYARSGTLEVALDSDGARRLEQEKQTLGAAGVAADLLDVVSLRQWDPSVTPDGLAGLLTRVHGFVGVSALVRALMHRARFSGAVFESPIEVASVESLRDGVEVQAGRQLYRAEMAVVAAGSWSRRVRVKHVAAFPTRPIRGQLLHLHWTDGAPPRQIVWGPRCYTVPWPDGTLLVGATAEDVGFDEHATVAGVQALTTAVTELLPRSASARVAGVRVGLRPAVPDGLPAIGPLARAPRVVMATGHFRNGILLAPLTAELVSRFILDGVRDDAFRLTSPDRFLG